MQGGSIDGSLHKANVVKRKADEPVKKTLQQHSVCQLPKVFMQYSATSCLAALYPLEYAVFCREFSCRNTASESFFIVSGRSVFASMPAPCKICIASKMSNVLQTVNSLIRSICVFYLLHVSRHTCELCL